MRAATLPRREKKGEDPVNANDVQLTELTTAQSGSTVEDNAPNAPGQPAFDVVVEAVAGSALGVQERLTRSPSRPWT
jgi:hypothetical protein